MIRIRIEVPKPSPKLSVHSLLTRVLYDFEQIFVKWKELVRWRNIRRQDSSPIGVLSRLCKIMARSEVFPAKFERNLTISVKNLCLEAPGGGPFYQVQTSENIGFSAESEASKPKMYRIS